METNNGQNGSGSSGTKNPFAKALRDGEIGHQLTVFVQALKDGAGGIISIRGEYPTLDRYAKQKFVARVDAFVEAIGVTWPMIRKLIADTTTDEE